MDRERPASAPNRSYSTSRPQCQVIQPLAHSYSQLLSSSKDSLQHVFSTNRQTMPLYLQKLFITYQDHRVSWLDYPTLPIGFHWAPLGWSRYIYIYLYHIVIDYLAMPCRCFSFTACSLLRAFPVSPLGVRVHVHLAHLRSAAWDPKAQSSTRLPPGPLLWWAWWEDSLDFGMRITSHSELTWKCPWKTMKSTTNRWW